MKLTHTNAMRYTFYQHLIEACKADTPAVLVELRALDAYCPTIFVVCGLGELVDCYV